MEVFRRDFRHDEVMNLAAGLLSAAKSVDQKGKVESLIKPYLSWSQSWFSGTIAETICNTFGCENLAQELTTKDKGNGVRVVVKIKPTSYTVDTL